MTQWRGFPAQMTTEQVRHFEWCYDLEYVCMHLPCSMAWLRDQLKVHKPLFPARFRPTPWRRGSDGRMRTCRCRVLLASEVCALREMRFRGPGRNIHYFGSPTPPTHTYRSRTPTLTGAVPLSVVRGVRPAGEAGEPVGDSGDGLGESPRVTGAEILYQGRKGRGRARRGERNGEGESAGPSVRSDGHPAAPVGLDRGEPPRGGEYQDAGVGQDGRESE